MLFEPWSRAVSSHVGNKVIDENNETHLSKLVLPVPSTSESTTTMDFARGGSSRVEASKKQNLQTFADMLVARLRELGRNASTADAAKFLRSKPGFDAAMRNVSTFGEFVRLFPEQLKMITAASGGASKVSLTEPTPSRRRLGISGQVLTRLSHPLR